MIPEARRLACTFRRNLDLITRQAAGVPEDAAHLRAGEGSSLNWVVGHALASRTRILEPLGAVPEGLDVGRLRALYGMGKTPDPAAAWPLAALLGWLAASQDRLEASLPLTNLSRPVQSPFGIQPLADLLDYFAWHEATHAGQVAVLRRLADSREQGV